MHCRREFPALLLAALLLAATSCNHPAASTATRSDPQIASDVQARLHAESALAGQNIQVSVDQGRVTLSGSAADAASRALAGNDAGSVSGVRTVVNNLTIATAAQKATESAAAPAAERVPDSAHRRHAASPSPVRPAHLRTDRAADDQPPVSPSAPPANLQDTAMHSQPPAPAPAPVPTVRTLTVPAGTVIPVRLVDDLSSATATADMSFHATLASDLVVDNMIVAPQGTPILGRVVDAKDATHFRGSSLLSLELTRIDLPGAHTAIVTDTFEKQGNARGKNTAEKVGGGAVLGTLIGALAGGGKGAAIGAIAGAGAGGAVNGATRGQQVELPSETLLSFALQSPITVTTSRLVGSPAPGNQPPDTPTLQPRQPQ